MSPTATAIPTRPISRDPVLHDGHTGNMPAAPVVDPEVSPRCTAIVIPKRLNNEAAKDSVSKGLGLDHSSLEQPHWFTDRNPSAAVGFWLWRMLLVSSIERKVSRCQRVVVILTADMLPAEQDRNSSSQSRRNAMVRSIVRDLSRALRHRFGYVVEVSVYRHHCGTLTEIVPGPSFWQSQYERGLKHLWWPISS